MSDLQASTASDPNMQQLIAAIKEGWPGHRNSYSPSVKPFWNYRDGRFNGMVRGFARSLK